MLAKKQEVDLRASESKFGDPCGVDRALPQSVITRRKLEWCVFLAAPSPKFYGHLPGHKSPGVRDWTSCTLQNFTLREATANLGPDAQQHSGPPSQDRTGRRWAQTTAKLVMSMRLCSLDSGSSGSFTVFESRTSSQFKFLRLGTFLNSATSPALPLEWVGAEAAQKLVFLG